MVIIAGRAAAWKSFLSKLPHHHSPPTTHSQDIRILHRDKEGGSRKNRLIMIRNGSRNSVDPEETPETRGPSLEEQI